MIAVLLGWHLVPPESVEMPASPLDAVEAVLVDDVREEVKNHRSEVYLPRRVKVLEVEGPGPDDGALVRNLSTERETRIKVSALAKWRLVSRRGQ